MGGGEQKILNDYSYIKNRYGWIKKKVEINYYYRKETCEKELQ